MLRVDSIVSVAWKVSNCAVLVRVWILNSVITSVDVKLVSEIVKYSTLVDVEN